MSAKKAKEQPVEKSIPILKLSHGEARLFFLKGTSYCNFDLPPYFVFDATLGKVSNLLLGKDLKSFCKPNTSPRDFDDLNHTLFHNKDGKFAWRPLQLIHPALYVSLVHAITEKAAFVIDSKISARTSGLFARACQSDQKPLKATGPSRSFTGGRTWSKDPLRCRLNMST
jgi:hypothetical protein